MKIKFSLFISLLIVGLFYNNVVLAGKTSETLFIHAQSIFERSLAGDDSVTGVALQKFNILSHLYPDNPLFLAYYGYSNVLMARDAWPWEKNSYIEKGLDRIGKALQMLKPVHDREKMRGAPISAETRLIAISSFSKAPKSFNHFDKAKAVLNDLLQSSALNASPAFLQARIYRRASKIARMENQREKEIEYLQKILKVDPKGEFAKKARKRLRQLGK